MRVEPEQMLEQDWISAATRIKNSEIKRSLKYQQYKRDRDYGRAQQHDDAGCVIRPHKQRQTGPGHSRGAHSMHGDHKI